MTQRVAVSTLEHAQLAWQPVRGYLFASGHSFVPLAFDELTSATSHFVLGFIKNNNRFRLVAFLGPGLNAYVHPSSGQWLGGYVPAGFRAEPFELGATEENPDEPLLCIAPDALVEGNAPGAHRLFDSDGKLVGKSAEVLEFLHKRLKGTLAAEKVGAELAALIEPWPLVLTRNGKPHSVEGLYRVNEQGLKALPAERLQHLNQCNGLALAYAQLLSTGHLPELEKHIALIESLSILSGPIDLNAYFSDEAYAPTLGF